MKSSELVETSLSELVRTRTNRKTIVKVDKSNPYVFKKGPFFFRVLRVLDMPQAVTMALERSKVVIYQDGDAGWEYPRDVARKLEWKNKLQVRSPSP